MILTQQEVIDGKQSDHFLYILLLFISENLTDKPGSYEHHYLNKYMHNMPSKQVLYYCV